MLTNEVFDERFISVFFTSGISGYKPATIAVGRLVRFMYADSFDIDVRLDYDALLRGAFLYPVFQCHQCASWVVSCSRPRGPRLVGAGIGM